MSKTYPFHGCGREGVDKRGRNRQGNAGRKDEKQKQKGGGGPRLPDCKNTSRPQISGVHERKFRDARGRQKTLVYRRAGGKIKQEVPEQANWEVGNKPFFGCQPVEGAKNQFATAETHVLEKHQGGRVA